MIHPVIGELRSFPYFSLFQDDTVWVRMAKKNDKGAGKVEWDTTTGEEWSRIQVKQGPITVLTVCLKC